MDKLIELLKGFFDGEEEALSDKEIEVIKGLSDEEAEAAEGALDTLTKFKESFPDDLLDATKILAKRAVLAKAEKTEPIEEDLIETLIDVKKAGARLSKANIEKLKKAVAIIEGLIGQKEDAVKKDHKDLPADVISKLERLGQLEDEVKKAEAEKNRTEDRKALQKSILEELQKKYDLKAKRGTSSVDDQDDDDDDADDDDKKKKKKKTEKGEKWPSLNKILQ